MKAASSKMRSNKKYFVHGSSYVDDGCEIGSHSKIRYFSHVQSGTQIVSNCSIGQNVNIGNRVTIGNSEQIADTILSLPMHPYLEQEEQDYIIATIIQSLTEA